MSTTTATNETPSRTPSPRRKRRPRLERLTALAIGCVIAFLIGEIAVRMLASVQSVGPGFSVFDPVYGRTHKKDFAATRITPEFTMHITLNAQGFRGPELAFPVRNSVLFLGDSFTEGYGVNDGEDFPRLLGQKLSRRYGAMQVINNGVGATGNGRWIKFLEREAAEYHPKLVVLQFCGNDFGDNVGERLYTVDDHGNLIERPVPPPSNLERFAMWVDRKPLSRRNAHACNSPPRARHMRGTRLVRRDADRRCRTRAGEAAEGAGQRGPRRADRVALLTKPTRALLQSRRPLERRGTPEDRRTIGRSHRRRGGKAGARAAMTVQGVARGRGSTIFTRRRHWDRSPNSLRSGSSKLDSMRGTGHEGRAQPVQNREWGLSSGGHPV